MTSGTSDAASSAPCASRRRAADRRRRRRRRRVRPAAGDERDRALPIVTRFRPCAFRAAREAAERRAVLFDRMNLGVQPQRERADAREQIGDRVFGR